MDEKDKKLAEAQQMLDRMNQILTDRSIEFRLDCLRLAGDHIREPDAMIEAAAKLHAFISGK